MGRRALIENLLSRGTQPTKPARSMFGADAGRELADRSKAQDLELEIEKRRGLRGS